MEKNKYMEKYGVIEFPDYLLGFERFDTSERKDMCAVTVLEKKSRTIVASMIIRTDNPDPNSWVRKFWQDWNKKTNSVEHGKENLHCNGR